MKIFFQHQQKFYRLIPTTTTTTTTTKKEHSNDSKYSSCYLTLGFLFGMLLCCLSWILAIWFASRIQGKTLQQNSSLQCSAVPQMFRFDCYPNADVDQEKCESRGCCWNPVPKSDDSTGIPFCFYPTGFQSHSLVNATHQRGALVIIYQRLKNSGYPGDVDYVKVEIELQERHRLRIKISDALRSRFEVPFLPESKTSHDLHSEDHDFKVEVSKSGFGFRILRKSTNQILFSTAGGFVFSDQFLQISSLLPSHFIYGLGENRSPFLKSTQWSQYSLWTADQWPAEGSTNLYGSHPFYLSMDDVGKAHGVFLKNSNAMDIILQPTPAITFRTLGGIFDFYIFDGPNPISVVEQYTETIGRPFLPPYWSLGYQQCKFGYGSLERTKEILDQTQTAGIPIDVQWNDIDYMDANKDFTLNKENFKNLKEFITDLHKNGLHYIPIIDPGISGSEPKGTYPPWDLGLSLNVFITNSSGQPFVGKVWNRDSTVWPDFTHPQAAKYWTKLLTDFHNEVPFDGVWIDMNEPSNFLDGQEDGCPKTGKEGDLNNPPYVPKSIQGGTLFYHTVCPSAQQSLGSHYDLHNLYGFSETIVTNEALRQVRGARPFIVSRSTFPGQGHFGAHWTGDVLSDWGSMKQSVTDIMNFNLFGIPMVGADICGFNGNTTVELCNRWMQLGAFYPFSRNHNTDTGIDQDPVSLGPLVVKSSKNALAIRYSILPYLYTQMVQAHLKGTPVAMPTFFHFPEDRNTYFLDEQFMLGESILVAPVLYPDATDVTIYLAEGVWYLFENKSKITSERGDFYDLDAPLDKIPVLVRGGSVIVTQGNGSTTTESRKNPFSVSVYMDEKGSDASGSLYIDDGDSLDTYENGEYTHIQFRSKFGQLSSNILHHGYFVEQNLSDIFFYGLADVDSIKSVLFDGKPVKFNIDSKLEMLSLQNLNADLTQPFRIHWT